MPQVAATRRIPVGTPLNEDGASQCAVMEHGGRPLAIHYTDSAPGLTHGPVVAMLHGSGPGSTGWTSFAANRDALVDAGHRVICPDLPGWGRSAPVLCLEDRSSLNARALAAVLQAAGVERPVHVMGASMGAHSAVAFALQWPQRVAKLVLVSGGTGGRSSFQPALPEGVRLMLAFYRSPTAENMRRFIDAVVCDPAPYSDTVIQTMVAAAQLRPEHLHNFSMSLAQHPQQFGDVTHRLCDIAAPALVIWGSEDRVVPLDIGIQMAMRMQQSDLHVMGRCGHIPHVEQAHKFNRLLTQFLSV